MSKPSQRRQLASPPTGPRTAQPHAEQPTAGPTSSSTSSSPTGTARAGRRERARSGHQQSFMERNRTPMVAVAALAGVVLISAFVFLSASAPAYACSSEWVPDPTPSPALGAPANLGYVQPDTGTRHLKVGEKATYTYCPPATGAHYNAQGAGPIQPRVYGPSDRAIPEGWLHSLEHGGLVILYRGDGPGGTDAGQVALRTLFDEFPNSPRCGIAPGIEPGVVVARFDTMATPFSVIVWGRVLPLQTLDTAQILAFWNEWGERTNPEKLCTAPSPAPNAAPSPAPSPALSAEPASPSPS